VVIEESSNVKGEKYYCLAVKYEEEKPPEWYSDWPIVLKLNSLRYASLNNPKEFFEKLADIINKGE